MISFLRNLAVSLLPFVLRLIATQVEETFGKGGEEL